MEIDFTREQFEKLLDLAYLGNWAVNSYRIDDRIEEYEDLTEYLLSFAVAFGFKEKIDFDEGEGQYFPSRRFEEKNLEFIEEYEEENFWDNLILRLAERDLVREYGEAAVNAMSWDEMEKKKAPYLRKYQKEIDENGIENLEVYKIS